ncbi:MAG: hypothetical protein IPP79_10135 [Chitinophagaceae bacterium]|nr:hypothetical protein [Chitinophagaceae bacterium]
MRQMGADIVIGSNVSTGLLPKEKVNNAIQVLMQIAFFKEAEDTRREIALSDIYIPIPVDNYTSASFNKAIEIIETGLNEGDKWYPVFKHLADSLNAIYGHQAITTDRLPKVDSIKITSIDVEGLKNTTDDFFVHMMGYYNNRYYTPEKLGKW